MRKGESTNKIVDERLGEIVVLDESLVESFGESVCENVGGESVSGSVGENVDKSVGGELVRV